jgi:protein-tyrosine phosphatase
MPDMKKILFLCMGNICRSPAGHCVFQHLVDEAGRTEHFEIESAGTIGFHVGAAPDKRMQQSMRARQIPIIGHSRQLIAADLEYYDLILAVDKANLVDAQRLDPNGQLHHKIQLFCNFCTQHREAEVPDPYYGGDQGFEYVLNIMQDGCANLLQELTT